MGTAPDYVSFPLVGERTLQDTPQSSIQLRILELIAVGP